MLLVLEDLHWVDRSTREFVRFLVRGLRGERVAVAMSFRTGELSADHPVREMLAELQYHDRVTLAELGPLAQEGVARAARRHPRRAAAGRSIVDEVHARCGGNPLFAEELLSARLERDGRRSCPRASPTRCACGCGARPRPCAGCCPTPPRSAAPRRRTCSAPPPASPSRSSRRALREALDHHLLAHRGDGTFAFRHDVVREAVYGDLLPGERAALHAAVAGALGRGARQRRAGLPLARRRPRRGGAARLGRAPGCEAEDARAFAEALRHFE